MSTRIYRREMLAFFDIVTEHVNFKTIRFTKARLDEDAAAISLRRSDSSLGITIFTLAPIFIMLACYISLHFPEVVIDYFSFWQHLHFLISYYMLEIGGIP